MNLLLLKRRKTSEDFTSEELNRVPAWREQLFLGVGNRENAYDVTCWS